MAQGPTDAFAQAILDYIFRGEDPDLPETYYAAIMTTMPDATGANGVEMSWTSYGRVGLDRDTTDWAAAALASGENRSSNGILVDFGTPDSAPSASGAGVGICLFDAETEGNVVWSLPFAEPI